MRLSETLAAIIILFTADRAVAMEPDAALRSRDGEAIYLTRCAGCHAQPAGRVPDRSALAAFGRGGIVNALVDGPMQPQAAGLTMEDMAAVAAYLSPEVGVRGREPPACVRSAISWSGLGWNGWGAGPANLRFQPSSLVTTHTIGAFRPLWAVRLEGARTSQPTIAGNVLLVTNTSGTVMALDRRRGCLIWSFRMKVGGRASITVGREGRQRTAFVMDYLRNIYALDAETGSLRWRTEADDQPGAVGTGAPVLWKGVLYVPISSAEELYAQASSYPCCRFRGAVVALDGRSGRQLWKTYTSAVEPHRLGERADGQPRYGPAGGAIWSAPTVDARRRRLYVATGNAYTDPDYDGADSILALDLRSGRILWSRRFEVNLPSVMGCYQPPLSANCPRALGPDFDFGASVILATIPPGRDVLIAGQKSGAVYALDPDRSGAVLWRRRLSPGGPLGGIEFGIATDQRQVFVGISDIFVATGARPGLSALRLADGVLSWTSPSPARPCRWSGDYCHPGMSQAVSAVGDLVFAGALNGRLGAYDARDGRMLWEFDTGEAIDTLNAGMARGGVLDGGGVTAAGGMVYVASGYAGRQGHPDSLLIAFGAPRQRGASVAGMTRVQPASGDPRRRKAAMMISIAGSPGPALGRRRQHGTDIRRVLPGRRFG